MDVRRRLTVFADAPIIVDVEDFDYSYKCKHCGHQWDEIIEKDETYRDSKGYTGD